MLRILLCTIIVLLLACNRGKDKPDVSGIKVDVQIERFEHSFFKIDTNNIRLGLTHLRNTAPRFYPVFMQDILQLNPMDTATFSILKTIINSYKSLNDSIQDKYENMNWLKEDLDQNFKYVKYYYPNYNLPRVITFVGTLDAPGIVLTPEYLGIGLHQYAGKNFTGYQLAEVQQMYPAYISRRFDKEYMTVNCMKAIADDLYPDQSAGKPLIEQIIEKGKAWYLLDRFAPDEADSVKTGYTRRQLDWVEENEGNVWANLIKNENIYSIEPPVIQTYLGEAPFTQNMSESSPGNLGQWIGWRIVQEYANKNEELTVQQILQTPARAIFDGAKYRPK